MKVLVNWRDSVCLDCGRQGMADTSCGDIVCDFCGSTMMTDLKGREFVPLYIKDRRCRNWTPKDKEKRMHQVV